MSSWRVPVRAQADPRKEVNYRPGAGGRWDMGPRIYLCMLMNCCLGSLQLMELSCPWSLLPTRQVSLISNNLKIRRNSTRKMLFPFTKRLRTIHQLTFSPVRLPHLLEMQKYCKSHKLCLCYSERVKRVILAFISSRKKAGKLLEL